MELPKQEERAIQIPPGLNISKLPNPMHDPLPSPPSTRVAFSDSVILRSMIDYKKGRASKAELLRVVSTHREDLFNDDRLDGNLLHELIRRGRTKTLLQVLLPNFPDAVMATEQEEIDLAAVSVHSFNHHLSHSFNHSSLQHQNGSMKRMVTFSLLRRAYDRKDRALMDGIITAIGYVIERSQKETPEWRQRILETLLNLEDWRLALEEHPILLDNPVVPKLMSLQPSYPRVVCADGNEYRVQIGYDQIRTLGSNVAFPIGFWRKGYCKKRTTLFSKEGIKLLFPQPPRPNLTTANSNSDIGSECGCEDGISYYSNTSYPNTHPKMEAAESSVIYRGGETTETSGVEVEAVFGAFPDALASGDNSFLRLCCELYQRTGKTWLFELDVVSVMLEFKWKAFGRPIYKFLLGISFILATNYTLASAHCTRLLNDPRPSIRLCGIIWQTLIMVNALPLVLHAYWHMCNTGFRAYLQDPWSALDFVVLILLYLTVALRFTLPILTNLYYLAAAGAALLLWFRLFGYLRGFRNTGPLVRMIWRIVRDIRFFLMVLTFCIIAFGNCLYLLFQVDIDRENKGDAPVSSIRSSYGDLFHCFLVLFGALNGNYDWGPYDASTFGVLASIIFVLFCVCSTIILLNLLIALMGDSYDRIQETALAQGRYEQAVSILLIEDTLPKHLLDDHRFFPRWVQVLRPKGYAEMMREHGIDKKKLQWNGKLRQIYKKIENSEKQLTKDLSEVQSKILATLEGSMGAAAYQAFLAQQQLRQQEGLGSGLGSIDKDATAAPPFRGRDGSIDLEAAALRPLPPPPPPSLVAAPTPPSPPPSPRPTSGSTLLPPTDPPFVSADITIDHDPHQQLASALSLGRLAISKNPIIYDYMDELDEGSHSLLFLLSYTHISQTTIDHYPHQRLASALSLGRLAISKNPITYDYMDELEEDDHYSEDNNEGEGTSMLAPPPPPEIKKEGEEGVVELSARMVSRNRSSDERLSIGALESPDRPSTYLRRRSLPLPARQHRHHYNPRHPPINTIRFSGLRGIPPPTTTLGGVSSTSAYSSDQHGPSSFSFNVLMANQKQLQDTQLRIARLEEKIDDVVKLLFQQQQQQQQHQQMQQQQQQQSVVYAEAKGGK